MSQMEMDALVGKTIGELCEAGYDDSESGTEGDDMLNLKSYDFTLI